MVKELGAELDVNAARGVRQCIRSEILKDYLEQTQDDEATNYQKKSRISFVDEHLINSDLKEDRRNETTKLNKQRGQQYARKWSAIAPNRRPKPIQTEFSRRPLRGGPASNENDCAVPLCGKVISRLDLERALDRFDDADAAVIAAPSENRKAALFEPDDRRKGSGSQALLALL